LSGVIICPANRVRALLGACWNKDSGYEANSIAFSILRRGQKKSTLLDSRWFRDSKLRNGRPGDAIPISDRLDAAGARCADTSEWKKIDSGTERNDT
jgi:hypothetical protein